MEGKSWFRTWCQRNLLTLTFDIETLFNVTTQHSACEALARYNIGEILYGMFSGFSRPFDSTLIFDLETLFKVILHIPYQNALCGKMRQICHRKRIYGLNYDWFDTASVSTSRRLVKSGQDWAKYMYKENTVQAFLLTAICYDFNIWLVSLHTLHYKGTLLVNYI